MPTRPVGAPTCSGNSLPYLLLTPPASGTHSTISLDMDPSEVIKEEPTQASLVQELLAAFDECELAVPQLPPAEGRPVFTDQSLDYPHMYHRCPALNIGRETNIVPLPVAILGNLYRRACDMLRSAAWKFSKTLGKMLGSFGS